MTWGGSVVGLEEVAELRALFRRRDLAARRFGLAILRSWRGRDLDRTGARAVLEACGGSYPNLSGVHDQPAELFAQLLWVAPRLVPASDVVRVYLLAGERVRRSLVHLLALRNDGEGLGGLEKILGAHGPADRMLVPVAPLLDPLEFHPELSRVVELLISLLGRMGWTWHAAELLARIERCSPSDSAVRQRMLWVSHCAAEALVDVCDRATLGNPCAEDAARAERQALSSLMWLVDELEEHDTGGLLARMLGAADPRVAAMAAPRLLARFEPVAPERLELIAREPLARADLHDGLVALALTDVECFDTVAIAEGRLARWLSDVTELSRLPDELEHVVTLRHPNGTGEPVHLFRFRLRDPHWSAARGWMVGMVTARPYSSYCAEDECPPLDHVTAMLAECEEWPDHRADGTA